MPVSSQVTGSTPLSPPPSSAAPVAEGQPETSNKADAPHLGPTVRDWLGEADAPGSVVSRELMSTWRVSQGPAGELGDGPVSSVAMSVDGRVIAFPSAAGNLVAGDDNGFDDVFVSDSSTGDTRLVSADETGATGDGWSSGPAVSADGRFVAFYSWASNLVSDDGVDGRDRDTNFVQDLFLWDAASGAITRISRAADGTQANDRSGDSRSGARPAISADGSVIAYHSQAGNLVDLDTNGRQDVFVYDAGQRRTTRVSVSSDGAQGDGDSRDPSLSADGRMVAFASGARTLDDKLSNAEGVSQIFVHDRVSGRTRLVSAVDGEAGDGDSFAPSISGDGSTLVFASRARNLVPDDGNETADVLLADLASGQIERVSVSSAGTQGNADSFAPSISLDGRHVAYASAASNLVTDDRNGAVDIFVYDRLTRHTGRASVGVTGPWTGVEANGDSYGPPAMSAGGRLVTFVSEARNLVAGETPVFAEAYALERAELPSYAVSGRVLDEKNQPLSGVSVAAGPHAAVTGRDGRYTLTNLPGGTYIVAPSGEDVSFAPARRTVSVVADTADVDFRALTNGGARLSFLALPVGGELSTAEFLQALRDSDEGGWVDAWFDHDAPDKSKNRAVQMWDGRVRTAGFFNAALGCYERRCYDGHDGTDFPYRDPNPATVAYEPVRVRAAAPGIVVRLYGACVAGERWCNEGYGNEVILAHDNGYFTRYAHLDSIDLRARSIGARVGAGDALGILGSTGNSFGAHLHFAVHQDDGNGRWDGADQDAPVDPFGWSGGEPDPWAEAEGGAVSLWMWNEHPTVERLLFGSHGAVLQELTGVVTVRIPAGALSGQARLELDGGAAASAPEEALRSLGHPFRVRLLDWYAPSEQSATAEDLQDAALALPMEVSVALEATDTRHLDLSQAIVQRWDEGAERWQPLPTVVEPEGLRIRATSDRLGQFDAQAPLLCEDDPLESDDDYFAASYVETGDPPLRRLFDLETDEDWVRFDAAAGQGVRLHVDQIADGVALVAELYDVDGLTRLASAESVAGQPVQIAWSAPADGAYFVRVGPTPGSRAGCTAAYSLTLD